MKFPLSISGSLFEAALVWISMLSYSPAFSQFSRGADIGWLSQMEATGYRFYDTLGVEKNCLLILKEHGINTIRLRVWVNPSNDRINGHCSRDEVVAMALRARDMGMRIMIDFHYSDSWADPGKQYKPAAWVGHTFSQLLDDLYNHTTDVLTALKSAGVTPDWVQVGNEIIGGMLWPDGSTDHWDQLAQLLNKGYDAVKAVDSTIKVIIHSSGGENNSTCRWFFDNVQNRNVKYDIIGLSYYPYWIGSDYTVTIDALGANLTDMVSRYGKPVMVVEVGGEYNKVQNTYDMLKAVLNKVRAVPDNKGLGVIYWEPEGEKTWSGYSLSCWGSDGRPTAALKAFIDGSTGMYDDPDQGMKSLRVYPNPARGGSLTIEMCCSSDVPVVKIFDLTGRLMRETQLPGMPSAFLDFNLLPGIYMLNLDDGQRQTTRKLMVD